MVNVIFFAFFFKQNTPLHSAALNGCHNAVTYLVDKGADVNIRNHCGVSEYNCAGVLCVYMYSDVEALNYCVV